MKTTESINQSVSNGQAHHSKVPVSNGGEPHTFRYLPNDDSDHTDSSGVWKPAQLNRDCCAFQGYGESLQPPSLANAQVCIDCSFRAPTQGLGGGQLPPIFRAALVDESEAPDLCARGCDQNSGLKRGSVERTVGLPVPDRPVGFFQFAPGVGQWEFSKLHREECFRVEGQKGEMLNGRSLEP